MKFILPYLLSATSVCVLSAQSPTPNWTVAVFKEREAEDIFRTGRDQHGNTYEEEFKPMRRTGLEVGWWREGSAFRPSFEFASGHAPQGSHSHASLHLEWGSRGPFLVQGGILFINQTHGSLSRAGWGGRLQLGWLFSKRVAVLAYAGLTSLFDQQAPDSSFGDFPSAFAGVKVAVRF